MDQKMDCKNCFEKWTGTIKWTRKIFRRNLLLFYVNKYWCKWTKKWTQKMECKFKKKIDPCKITN